MEMLEELEVKELHINEASCLSGGVNWFWQAAAATFLYNCVADWEENIAAFKSGYDRGAAF